MFGSPPFSELVTSGLAMLTTNPLIIIYEPNPEMNTDQKIQKSIKYLTEVEELGQDILTAKETKLRLANAQNKFREAHRALQTSADRRTWMQIGTVYVELPTEECKSILKDELDKVTTDVNDLYIDIKKKVAKLRDLEHEPAIEGFRLKPMTGAEAKAIHRAFGLS